MSFNDFLAAIGTTFEEYKMWHRVDREVVGEMWRRGMSPESDMVRGWMMAMRNDAQ